jgi:hypothetical protein
MIIKLYFFIWETQLNKFNWNYQKIKTEYGLKYIS